MIRKICFAAFAAIALLGCSEKDAELPHVEENAELVTFSVSVPGLDTKSTGGSADDEKTINRLQVFVFNRHGVYETSAVAAEGNVTITSAKITGSPSSPLMSNSTLHARQIKQVNSADMYL